MYPYSALLTTTIVDCVREHMRRGRDIIVIKLSDGQWNDPGPRNRQDEHAENLKWPTLHTTVLDFSGV